MGLFSRNSEEFKSTVTLHIRIALLSDVCQVAGYPQGRSINPVLQTLMGPELMNIVPTMGALYRHSIWENLNLSRELNANGLGHLGRISNVPSPGQTTPREPELGTVNTEQRNVDEDSPRVDLPSRTAAFDVDSPAVKLNAKALSHIASELPKTLKNFFTGMSHILPRFLVR